MTEVVLRVKNCTMRRAHQHFAGRIVIDCDALMCAGAFTGDKTPAGQMNKQTGRTISRIDKTE
jgi:hypothetical protein